MFPLYAAGTHLCKNVADMLTAELQHHIMFQAYAVGTRLCKKVTDMLTGNIKLCLHHMQQARVYVRKLQAC